MDYFYDHATVGANMGGITGAAATCKLTNNTKRGCILSWAKESWGGMTHGGLLGAMDYIREPHRSGLTDRFYARMIEYFLQDNPDWASKSPAIGQPGAYWDWDVGDYLSKNRILGPPSYARRATAEMISGMPITRHDDVWIKDVIHKADADTYVLTNGDTITAPVWHDASYEGDALRANRVTMDYGRDNASTYGEPYAGRRPISEEGAAAQRIVDDDGNLWPFTVAFPPFVPVGTADQFEMGYVYRKTVSKHANRIPFGMPRGYRPEHFKWVLEAYKNATKFENLSSYKRINDHLFGCNGPSLQGVAWGYSLANSIAERRRIWSLVKYVQEGMYWTAMTNPAMTDAMRADMAAHGKPHDENQAEGEYFEDIGWDSHCYVREAGRMIGDSAITGEIIRSATLSMQRKFPVNLHGYGMDSHLFRKSPTRANGFYLEGSLSDVLGEGLWQVGLDDIRAPRMQAPRLISTWCISESRNAMCSSRIEPPAQMNGEVGGLLNGVALQMNLRPCDVPYEAILTVLRAQNHPLIGVRS